MARLSSRQQEFTANAYAAAYAAGLRGVQADLAVSQAVHESAWGAKPSGKNNVHGIKGKTGTSVKTHEYEKGKRVDQRATFRDFPSMVDSFKAWKSLMDRKFSAVMKATTLKEAIAGLRAGLPGGYATDPKYNDKVAAIGGLVGTTGVAMDPAPANMPTPTPSPMGMNAHAYAGLTRSLAPQSPTTPSQAYGQYARSMQDTGLLGLDNRAGNFSAPIGRVERGPALPDARPSNLDAAPVSSVQRAALPDINASVPTALGGIPSPMRPDNLAYAGPKGVFSVPAPTTPMPSRPVSLTPPAALAAMNVPAFAPPTTIAPPPAVFTPMPARPATPTPQAAFNAWSAPSSMTPGDIYGGMAGQAMSRSGNLVSGNGLGLTGVTNQFGASTGMMGGYQTAISGPLDGSGIKSPTSGMFGNIDTGKLGQAAKTGVASVAGSAIGSLGGPIGSMLGAAVARELSKPGGGIIGGLVNGTRTFDTNVFGNVRTNKAQSGLGFPDAPGGGYKGSASFSNRSERGMSDISPGASAAIGAGKGGLY